MPATSLLNSGGKTKDQQAEDGIGVSSDMEQPVADTSNVLEAISICKSTLTAKIDEVKMDNSLIRQDMSKLCDHVTKTETHISRMEDILNPLQHTAESVQWQIQ